ncbi:3050_t:CDS:2, partial [Paraglomus brasilianum]
MEGYSIFESNVFEIRIPEQCDEDNDNYEDGAVGNMRCDEDNDNYEDGA